MLAEHLDRLGARPSGSAEAVVAKTAMRPPDEAVHLGIDRSLSSLKPPPMTASWGCSPRGRFLGQVIIAGGRVPDAGAIGMPRSSVTTW